MQIPKFYNTQGKWRKYVFPIRIKFPEMCLSIQYKCIPAKWDFTYLFAGNLFCHNHQGVCNRSSVQWTQFSYFTPGGCRHEMHHGNSDDARALLSEYLYFKPVVLGKTDLLWGFLKNNNQIKLKNVQDEIFNDGTMCWFPISSN